MFPQIGACQWLPARRVNDLHIPAAMIRGNLAIPDKDPKSWRSRGCKPAQDIPTIIDGVKSPQQIARDKRIKRLREMTGG
jgi:hypothetical protein